MIIRLSELDRLVGAEPVRENWLYYCSFTLLSVLKYLMGSPYCCRSLSGTFFAAIESSSRVIRGV